MGARKSPRHRAGIVDQNVETAEILGVVERWHELGRLPLAAREIRGVDRGAAAERADFGGDAVEARSTSRAASIRSQPPVRQFERNSSADATGLAPVTSASLPCSSEFID